MLDDFGLEYTVIDDTHADVYAKPNFTKLAIALDREGCEVISVEERDESLESFYSSLVGGVDNE